MLYNKTEHSEGFSICFIMENPLNSPRITFKTNFISRANNSVVDHRWRQNVVRTEKWHTRRSRVCHWWKCFRNSFTVWIRYWKNWWHKKADLITCRKKTYLILWIQDSYTHACINLVLNRKTVSKRYQRMSTDVCNKRGSFSDVTWNKIAKIPFMNIL